MPRNCTCKRGGGPDDNRLDALPQDLREQIDSYLPIAQNMKAKLPRDLQRMILEYTGQSAQMTRDKYERLLRQLDRHVRKSGQAPPAYMTGNPKYDAERIVLPSKVKESVDWENGRPPQWYVERKAEDDARYAEHLRTHPLEPDSGISFSFGGSTKRRNCICHSTGGKTPHFNPGPNPQYTGLHRKKRTMMDKWIERGDRVHPVVDLTADSSDDEKRPVKRAKKGGVTRPGNETGLRGQPRFNPAVMDLLDHIEQLEERLERSTSEKERNELQRQLHMLNDSLQQLNVAEQQRREEGDGVHDLGPGELQEKRDQQAALKKRERKRKRDRDNAAEAEHHIQHENELGSRSHKSRVGRHEAEHASMVTRSRHHQDEHDALMARHRALMHGAGWEDEMAKATERDRLNELDKAEAKRLMADAERARRASLTKSTPKGKHRLKVLSSNLQKSGSVALRRVTRRGWSGGGTYCR